MKKEEIKSRIKNFLIWSQKYTKTDMVYLAKGGFWLTTGKIGIMLISLGTMAAFANWLPAKTFGTYQFVISIAGIAAIAGLPGIKTALVRSIAKGKEGSLNIAFKEKFSWSLIGSAGLIILAGWYFINENFLLAGAFLVPAIFLPLKTSAGIFASFWQGKKRFDIRTKLSIALDLGIAATLITALFFTNKLWLILTAFLGSTAFFYTIAYLYTKNKVKNKEIDENLIPFGKSLTLMNVIVTIAEYIDKVILWKLLGPIDVAIYAFALKPIEKVRGFTPIQSLALPKLIEKSIENKKQKKAIFCKFLLMFTVSIPLAVTVFLAAPFVYKFIFPQYMNSVIYFQALSLLIATLPLGILGTAFISEMKTRYLYIINTAVPLFKIILFLSLTPFYGIWGIVIGLLSAEILRGILSIYFFWKI